METRDAIRSVVEKILKPEQEECLVHILNGGDVVALLLTGFGKSLIYQLLPTVSEKLGRPKSGKAIIVIVSQLGVHNYREIMEGNFSLIFGIQILDSQSKMVSYVGINTKTNLSPLSLTRHTSHTNGEFAYTGLVINFNKLTYFNISSVRGG